MWQVKLQVSLLALKWGTSCAGPRVARKGTCLLLASGFHDPRAPSAVARSAAPLFSAAPPARTPDEEVVTAPSSTARRAGSTVSPRRTPGSPRKAQNGELVLNGDHI